MLRSVWRRARLLPDSVLSLREPSFARLRSQAPSASQVETAAYQGWLDVIHETNAYHRKAWEWCYILEAFHQSGSLRPGARALAFGVGREPIVAALAARGLLIEATDQPVDGAEPWTRTNQFAESLENLRNDRICPPDEFDRCVAFRPVDMREIPPTYRDFDLLWSSCCIEHLGSAQLGLDFVLESMKCLRPGGVAVHTTEYDVRRTDEPPVEVGDPYTVIYRRRDLEALILRLRREGHSVRANFKVSSRAEQDRFVDTPPYLHQPHLRLQIDRAVATSFGLIITKAG